MRTLLVSFGLVMLAACGGAADAPSEPAATETEAPVAAEISVEDAFVMVPLAGRDISMGGANISVSSGAARLVEASADFAEVIELHTMAMEDGTMRMRPVDGYDIVFGTPLQLQRGGDHLMLFGVSGLEAGGTYPVRLVFELGDGSRDEREILFSARTLGE